ncbi:VanZ family protein [bacterium]|nr:VanZ family protein [bacterium]
MISKSVFRILPAVIYLLATWLLSSDFFSEFVQSFNSHRVDKQLHFWGYGFLTLTIAYALPSKFVAKRIGLSWVLVILFVASWGALDEFHQSFVPGRQVDLEDWKADVMGAVVFSSLFFAGLIFKKKIQIKPILNKD